MKNKKFITFIFIDISQNIHFFVETILNNFFAKKILYTYSIYALKNILFQSFIMN